MAALIILAVVIVFTLSIRNFRMLRLVNAYAVKPLLSKLVNYTVYYFRRIVLQQSVEKAMREHYAGFSASQKRNNLKRQLPNIAVVNRNLSKYTETFIEQKVRALKQAGYFVHRFYGGYFPNAEADYGHLLSNNDLGKSFYCFWEALWGLPENFFLKRAFVNYLKLNRVKLVFAEFGTCGVEVYEACRQAGIPLIVTFRGYDIHHQDVMQANRTRYKEMFTYCSKVICVSNDIFKTIERQYGIGEKLVYLPSIINLNLFKQTDRNVPVPTVLYVGRFSETKSPHLVILAFNEVLKHIPDARLVMVGRGGGGELFEACLILAKALNLDDKIDFKGVLTPEQVYEEMQQASVFIQYSVTTPVTGDKEGTPVSLREAMATGLPVVATKHAGIEEIIEDGETGLLVDEYDQHAIVKALLRILNDRVLAKKLGSNAAAFVRSHTLISQNTSVLAKIVEEVRLS